MTGETFPIMPARVRGVHSIYDYFAAVRLGGASFVTVAVPWELMAPHEAQAKKNHSQTLTRLAERGGLSASEAVAVLEDRDWSNMPEGEAHRMLAALLLGRTGRTPARPPPDRTDVM